MDPTRHSTGQTLVGERTLSEERIGKKETSKRRPLKVVAVTLFDAATNEEGHCGNRCTTALGSRSSFYASYFDHSQNGFKQSALNHG